MTKLANLSCWFRCKKCRTDWEQYLCEATTQTCPECNTPTKPNKVTKVL